ncbi:ROK family protein [Falsihalocynthiibacter sp. SS001]|uniref:ROK family protein n=1 Tax=Falsihalocynthiibacter sp. SS001 TaxID=3349698 RepID=UPI0036D2266B
MLKIADPLLMREINKFSILETIRQSGEISRIEITNRTQLSRTTVSAITGALLETGLIETSHTEEPSRGRPRVKLALVADAAYAFGIALDANGLTLSLTNFRGDVMITARHKRRLADLTAFEIADFITPILREACAASNIDQRRVNGICIGIPSLTDLENATCTAEATFASVTPELRDTLAQRTGLRVFLENHANLLALDHQWTGHDGTCAFVVFHETLELSIIPSNGAHGRLAPAIGHTKIRANGEVCECGQVDCAQAYLSLSALTKLNGKAGQSLADLLAAVSPQHASLLADVLGQCVAHVLNLFAPQKLILTCDSSAFLEHISDELIASINKNTAKQHLNQTTLEFRAANPQNVARGATAFVLREFYNAPWLAKEEK